MGGFVDHENYPTNVWKLCHRKKGSESHTIIWHPLEKSLWLPMDLPLTRPQTRNVTDIAKTCSLLDPTKIWEAHRVVFAVASGGLMHQKNCLWNWKKQTTDILAPRNDQNNKFFFDIHWQTWHNIHIWIPELFKISKIPKDTRRTTIIQYFKDSKHCFSKMR